MNTNQDSWSSLTPRTVLGGGEGAQIFASIPTPQISGGFSFTPGGVTINGQTVQSNGGFQFDLPMASVQSFQNQALAFSANNSGINRGFLSGVISSGQNNVSRAQSQVLDFGRDILNSTERMNVSILDTQIQVAKRRNSGCFITTAICEADGLPDNCEVLQTFRKFRDTEMMRDDSGKNAVALYYETAPAILERIKKNGGAESILLTLKERFLMPAYDAIKSGHMEKARSLYYGMVISAKTFAGA